MGLACCGVRGWGAFVLVRGFLGVGVDLGLWGGIVLCNRLPQGGFPMAFDRYRRALMSETHRAGNELLQIARDLLEGYGWTQGVLKDDTGFCVRGAVLEACREMGIVRGWDSESRESVYHAAWGALHAKATCEGFKNVTDWNDWRGRTKDEVLDLFASVSVGG